MELENRINLQESYDRVAEPYAERLFEELSGKPLDCQLLDRLAESAGGIGPICDLGCGPGQVARYLHGRGAEVCGVDLSAGMVEQARRLNPGIPFVQGDMLALDIADETWGGIAAFYSLIHVPRPELGQAVGEMYRVLRPGGLALVAFHVGEETKHLEDWFGEPVSVDFFFFRPQEIKERLLAAGFVIEDVIEREPYPDVEHPSRRAYLYARKEGGSLDPRAGTAG